MTNPTLIATPFAENGDKNTIPESVGANPQNATMQAGFPPITQQKISEGGIPPERNDFNGILNLYGQHIVHLNKGLPYEFDQTFANKIGGYPIGAELVLSDGLTKVVNTVANNTNDPNVNMTGWVKPEKIFNIEYFGGVADYDETTKTILTDSGDALREAIVEAKKVMGCVYIPSSPKGKAFYASGNFNLSVDGFTEGVRVIGDGKIASKLYASPIDVTKPIFGGETGAPGNPTNISISGMSLISHEKWVGTCLQFNGTCITEIPDLYIKDFDCNIEFVNDTLSPYGIFTEFVRVSNSHLRNGKTNLRFRRRNNGDASFHGVNFSGLSMDGTDEAGQIGIDIGEGCYIYSASWSQVNIFSTGEGIALKNAGNRNGFDELYFEGNGRVENTSTGTWNTDGRWFVQNETGSFDDRSVGDTQFITGNYQTSKNNTSSDFTNLGLSKFKAGIGDTARKKLTRILGDGIEGFSLNFFTGNNNSWSGTQGLALTYSTNNDQNSKPDGIACYLTLNRFSSFLSDYNFSYKQDTPQLTINSSGRHTGRMGRYKSVVVPISSSGQTVTITGLMPTTQQSVLISIDCSANNISYSALYLCSKWNGATTTGVLIGISRFENMPSGISQVYTNDGGLNIVFDSAVSVALNMNISVVGVGIY